MFFARQKSEPALDHWSDRKCKACWRKGEDKPCPCWVDPVDGMSECDALGNSRAITGCMYQVLPRMLTYAIKAAGHAAASADKNTNTTAQVTDVIARVLTKATDDYNVMVGKEVARKVLEAPRGESDSGTSA